MGSKSYVLSLLRRQFDPTFQMISAACLMTCACVSDAGSIDLENWWVLHSAEPEILRVTSDAGWQPIGRIDDIYVSRMGSENPAVWLKSVFHIREPEKYFGLSMEEVNLWERTYVNGTLVSGPADMAGPFDQPRRFIIPRSVLRDGENAVHILLTSHAKWTLGISGRISIHTESGFDSVALGQKIRYEYAPVAICVVIAGIVLSLLIRFLFNREEKEHLLMALRLAVILVVFVSLEFPLRAFSIDSAFILWTVSIPLVMIAFFLYYQAIYGLYFSTENRIMIVGCVLLSGFGLLDSLVLHGVDAGALVVLAGFAVPIAYCFFVLARMHGIRKSRFNLVYCAVELAGVVFMAVSLLLFFLAGLGGWNDPSEFMIAGAGVLSINTIVYYARRDDFRKKTLHELQERFSFHDRKRKNAISESAEDKLHTLIEFIQKNHAEQLTRESLAEVVGMNPNYLSGLFNSFTGKSLSAYIAEIRVRESLGPLARTGRTIIDVAFSCGFYSLATFNRSFKQVMKMTPSEYRRFVRI